MSGTTISPKNNRRDPETANDPDGCQIETIMLDHQSPDHRYSLHPGELVFAKSWQEEDKFTLFSALATLVCIVSYIINIGTDVAVSYLLFVEGNFWWFGFTVASTAIPALTVNIFSIRWYTHDAQETKSQSEALAKPHTSKKDWIMRIFFHIVLLGPVLRKASRTLCETKHLQIFLRLECHSCARDGLCKTSWEELCALNMKTLSRSILHWKLCCRAIVET
ncbi:uncharacterized protein LOC143230128 isoform X1 [Tachypleus tridentatus]|uniref:uncharacterized protein LOC143230128 isoform X1 n=1 Tax=Tachypleus tridentatus TaxID=6853 RepID=UPI003FCF594C